MFASYNLQRLRVLLKAELVTEFAGLKLNPRQKFVSTGMQDLPCKLLTVVKPICLMQRSADLTLLTQAMRNKLMLQAEQPLAIECAAS